MSDHVNVTINNVVVESRRPLLGSLRLVRGWIRRRPLVYCVIVGLATALSNIEDWHWKSREF